MPEETEDTPIQHPNPPGVPPPPTDPSPTYPTPANEYVKELDLPAEQE